MLMPPLETERLIVRPYVMGDLEAISQDLDEELTESPTSSARATRLEESREWLLRQIAFYETLEERGDPPFGDRAVVLKATGAWIGAAGYALYLGNFGRLPSFSTGRPVDHLNRVEPGLYWAIDPAHRRQGYASEAARALIAYAFEHLKLQYIIAGTNAENSASIRVMRKVGMRIERNPDPDPAWMQ
ncbi:MAG TPA: GNAT family N-acetyltransferase, partial [Ardenticatenaceae bacterium]|nr:GNAT family N-acetyltransferase [Ardenticatenaceae bacterium]